MASIVLLTIAFIGSGTAFGIMSKKGEIDMAHLPMKYMVVMLGYLVILALALIANEWLMVGLLLAGGAGSYALAYRFSKAESWDDSIPKPKDEFVVPPMFLDSKDYRTADADIADDAESGSDAGNHSADDAAPSKESSDADAAPESDSTADSDKKDDAEAES